MLVALMILASANREVDVTPTRDAVLHVLKGAPDATAVTVIVCTGPAPQTAPEQAAALMVEISKALNATRPALQKSVVARAIDAKTCSAGAKMQIDMHDAPGTLAEARVLASAGNVVARARDGTEVPLFKDSIVPEQAQIKTGPGGRCSVRLPDGTRVAVRENTTVSLNQLAQQANGKEKPAASKLKLLVGSIWSRFSKSLGSHDLQIETPTVTAGVRGTDFQLDASAQDSKVAVTEGKVNAAAGGANQDVPEGFALVAAKTLGPLRPLPPAPENLVPTSARVQKEQFLRWDDVPGATSYRFELARDVAFTDVVHDRTLKISVLRMEAPPGVYYWRVFSRDALDIESAPSKLYQIEFLP